MDRADPEKIFDAFVMNAVAEIGVTRNEPAQELARVARVADVSDELDASETTQRVAESAVSLRAPTSRGPKRRPDPITVTPVTSVTPPPFDNRALPDWMNEAEEEKETTAEIVLLTKIKSSPALVRHDDTMQLEAALAVPDIASVIPPPLPVREASEDGQIPAGELDRVLSDMMVLARYGHFEDVRARLDGVTQRYPEDILLLRRVVEFHIELGDRFGAIESLFTLALRLFERRNVVGMRQALEQVLIIEPDNRRAYKLLGLLEQRPSTGTGG